MTSDDKLRRLDDDLQSKKTLLHELQVHQIELEMQNVQLRETQQQLEESRDRFANLYDYAPVGYLTLDEYGMVLEINLTGAGMLGMERLNIVGQPFISRLTMSSIQTFVKHLRQTFSSDANKVAEVQIKVKGDRPRIVSLESMAIQGANRVCRTVMHDISEQRRTAFALQISRAAQDALLKAIPAMVFYLDIDLRFLNVSQVFADFVRHSPEDIAGKTFNDVLPADIAEDFHQMISSVKDTGMALYGFENSMRDINGSMLYLSSVVAPFRDIEGMIMGLVGVSIDITSIKSASDLNSELLLENRKLTRSLYAAHEEERRHLAHELHDELGQWFTAIQAEAQIICNIAKHVPEIHDSALAISKNTSRVHDVIRGMLRHLRPSLLDELGLADSLRELQRQWCHSHPDIDCEFKLDTPLEGLGEGLNVTLYRLVQEALNNIAAHAHARRVVVSLQQETDKASGVNDVVLTIEDDGEGFDFKQVNTGLGMLGMRERVIAAGGDFYIDSVPGSGTKIRAKLPVSEQLERKA